MDGGSKDKSELLIKEMHLPNLKFLLTTPGRGQQLSYAAQKAAGDFFFFSHVDSVFEAGTSDIKKTITHFVKTNPSEKTLAFCKLTYDDDSWKANLLAKLVSVRVKWLGLPYGDQGLFVSKKLYNLVGGFNPNYPIMEDVDFILKAKKKKTTFKELPFNMETSFSKYRFFFFRVIKNFFCLALFFIKGAS